MYRQAQLQLNRRYLFEVLEPGKKSPIAFVVRPRNILLVGLGDSYASGEGNPDVPKGSDPSRWMFDRCHRSEAAPLTKFAAALERADMQSSVTLINVACSGATALNVTKAPYRGAAPNQFETPEIPPQLAEVKSMIRSRQPDAVTVSVGGNDVGFGAIIRDCFNKDCAGSALGDFETLKHNYASVRDCLAANARCPEKSRIGSFRMSASRSRTQIVAYPNPTRGSNGKSCGEGNNDEILWDLPHVGGKRITAAEAAAAEAKVFLPLNERYLLPFAIQERVGFVNAHVAPSAAHGYCAEDGSRWFWQRKESGKVQEEVLEVNRFNGLAKVHISPGTLYPNSVPTNPPFGGTDAIARAIADQLRADLTRRFPTVRRGYP